MTYGAWEVVGQKDQQLPLGKTIGDAFRELIAQRFQHNAAKKIERLYGYDPKTAKNIVHRGCVSERSLTKAALAEGWGLWMALGEQLFGQSYADWEERRLQAIIDRAENDLDRVRRLRPTLAPVSERSFDRDASDHLDTDPQHEPADRRARSAAGRGSLTSASGEGLLTP